MAGVFGLGEVAWHRHNNLNRQRVDFGVRMPSMNRNIKDRAVQEPKKEKEALKNHSQKSG